MQMLWGHLLNLLCVTTTKLLYICDTTEALTDTENKTETMTSFHRIQKRGRDPFVFDESRMDSQMVLRQPSKC